LILVSKRSFELLITPNVEKISFKCSSPTFRDRFSTTILV